MRDYTKIKDISKLPPSQQPNTERNIRIAELFLEGKNPYEIVKIIYDEYGDFLSHSRLHELKTIWTPYVLAKKGGK